jgi:hypothetical protein
LFDCTAIHWQQIGIELIDQQVTFHEQFQVDHILQTNWSLDDTVRKSLTTNEGREVFHLDIVLNCTCTILYTNYTDCFGIRLLLANSSKQSINITALLTIKTLDGHTVWSRFWQTEMQRLLAWTYDVASRTLINEAIRRYNGSTASDSLIVSIKASFIINSQNKLTTHFDSSRDIAQLLDVNFTFTWTIANFRSAAELAPKK